MKIVFIIIQIINIKKVCFEICFILVNSTAS